MQRSYTRGKPVMDPSTALNHMRLLHRLGFLQTAILECEVVHLGLHRVLFVHQQPSLATDVTDSRTPTPWPERQPLPRTRTKPYDPSQWSPECATCRLDFGLARDDLDNFFAPGGFRLCTTLEGLNLPETTAAFVSELQPNPGLPLSQFDRLVIHADGSSMSSLRHQPPLRLDEQGQGDTWSFVVIGEIYDGDLGAQRFLVGWQAQPVLYDSTCASFAGALHIGSDAAEREALLWSMIWRLSVNEMTPTVICTDSQLAQAQASGLVGARELSLSFRLLRGAAQALTAMIGSETFWIRHVRGHSSDPLNEFVDFAAKQERVKSFYLPRPRFTFGAVRDFLPYMWMLFHKDAGLPSVCQNGFHAPPPALPAPSGGEPNVPPSATWQYHHVCASFATANVQSLYQGADGHPGKIQYLRSQFTQLAINFLGLQETRSASICTKVDEVLRLSSGADRGHHGVELWINLACPIAYVQNKAQYLNQQEIVVLHATPRILLVRIRHRLFHGLLVVSHAPQSGCARQDRDDWWNHFSQLIDAHRQDATEHVFMMIDANAASGPSHRPHVGAYGDRVTASTPLLRDLLLHHDLCLPSTHCVHQGTHTTWYSPDGAHECRIDFVAVPTALLGACTHSMVLEDFDLGTVHTDHCAVALQLQWSDWHLTSDAATSRPGIQYDRTAMAQAGAVSSLRHLHVNEWNSDIELHVEQVLKTLAATYPVQRSAPKKPYVTPEIWRLRQTKLKVSASLRELHRRGRLEALFLTWRAWRGQHDPVAAPQVFAYGTSLRCYTVRLATELHVVSKCLRGLLRCSKYAYLAAQLQQCPPHSPASEILRLVQRLSGPTNPKKIKQKTLPMVKLPDGQHCATPQALVDRWVDFFGSMEGGKRMTQQELRECWRTNLALFRQEDFHLPVQDLPSLVDLERSYARVRAGKAIGLDQIPPELCRSNAAELARLSYAQLLKLAIHGQEAVVHKGGLLVQAHKGERSPGLLRLISKFADFVTSREGPTSLTPSTPIGAL